MCLQCTWPVGATVGFLVCGAAFAGGGGEMLADDQGGKNWHTITQDERVRVSVERVLYERPGQDKFFVQIRVTNRTTRKIGVALDYAEAIMQQHLPLEGQFFTRYMRLLRAARAFLDPMLNLGQLEPHQAKAFLIRELVLSEPMAAQELNRYTSWMPGQATSYYYGLLKLQALRTQTEIMLGGEFDQLSFHDFILAQGLLPPELLRKAVLEEFVPAARANNRSR